MPFTRQRFHYDPIIERSALFLYFSDLGMEGIVERLRWERGRRSGSADVIYILLMSTPSNELRLTYRA